MDMPAHRDRAFWTFLFVTLVGPFVAALIIFLLTIGSGLIGMGPPSLKGLGLDPLFSRAAVWAVSSYVWAAIPAALAGLALAALVLWRGTFAMLEAAIAAVLAFLLALLVLTSPPPGHALPLAIIAAITGVFCRHALLRARVLR